MPRKLKLWNGRWQVGGHIYVAAYSQADLLRLLDELFPKRHNVTLQEIRVYWSPNCWGTAMDGVTPERGAWVEEHHMRSIPVRVFPRITS